LLRAQSQKEGAKGKTLHKILEGRIVHWTVYVNKDISDRWILDSEFQTGALLSDKLKTQEKSRDGIDQAKRR
jgi:hypothetical protein